MPRPALGLPVHPTFCKTKKPWGYGVLPSHANPLHLCPQYPSNPALLLLALGHGSFNSPGTATMPQSPQQSIGAPRFPTCLGQGTCWHVLASGVARYTVPGGTRTPTDTVPKPRAPEHRHGHFLAPGPSAAPALAARPPALALCQSPSRSPVSTAQASGDRPAEAQSRAHSQHQTNTRAAELWGKWFSAPGGGSQGRPGNLDSCHLTGRPGGRAAGGKQSEAADRFTRVLLA